MSVCTTLWVVRLTCFITSQSYHTHNKRKSHYNMWHKYKTYPVYFPNKLTAKPSLPLFLESDLTYVLPFLPESSIIKLINTDIISALTDHWIKRNAALQPEQGGNEAAHGRVPQGRPWHMRECHYTLQGISLRSLLLNVIIKAPKCDPRLRSAFYIFALIWK